MAENNTDAPQRERISAKEAVKQKILEEQSRMKIHKAEGEYQFDNPQLEHKTKRQKKLSEMEDKYKDKPKIAFHELSEEGNKLFMQAKRDRVWTTLGWSLVGNAFAMSAVRFFDERPLKRYQGPRFAQ